MTQGITAGKSCQDEIKFGSSEPEEIVDNDMREEEKQEYYHDLNLCLQIECSVLPQKVP